MRIERRGKRIAGQVVIHYVPLRVVVTLSAGMTFTSLVRHATSSGDTLRRRNPTNLHHYSQTVQTAATTLQKFGHYVGNSSSGSTNNRYYSGAYPLCRVLATSAAGPGSSRDYGADYQEISLRNISYSLSLVVAKSFILAASEAMIEYNELADRNLKQLAAQEDEEETDWDQFSRRHADSCLKYFYKNLSTECIKKLYDYLARQFVSPKLFERLTKDPVKSAARKLIKYQHRFQTGNHMWFTFLWSKAILYVSFFTYDSVMAVWEFSKNPTRRVRVKRVLAWVGTKVASNALIMLGTATGFTIGYYISPSYGGHIGPILGEIAASALVTEYLSTY